jgi:hypothetical protein
MGKPYSMGELLVAAIEGGGIDAPGGGAVFDRDCDSRDMGAAEAGHRGASSGQTRHGAPSSLGAKGECRAAIAHDHWKTNTFCRLASRVSLRRCFWTGQWTENASSPMSSRTLAPALRRGDLVVMDNLATHKVAGIRQAIEPCGAGAKLHYVPPHGPVLNPIENAFRQAQGACAEVCRANPRYTRASRCQCVATVQT